MEGGQDSSCVNDLWGVQVSWESLSLFRNDKDQAQGITLRTTCAVSYAVSE